MTDDMNPMTPPATDAPEMTPPAEPMTPPAEPMAPEAPAEEPKPEMPMGE